MEEAEGYLTFELGTDLVHAVFTFEKENRNRMSQSHFICYVS